MQPERWSTTESVFFFFAVCSVHGGRWGSSYNWGLEHLYHTCLCQREHACTFILQPQTTHRLIKISSGLFSSARNNTTIRQQKLKWLPQMFGTLKEGHSTDWHCRIPALTVTVYSLNNGTVKKQHLQLLNVIKVLMSEKAQNVPNWSRSPTRFSHHCGQ